MSAENKAFDPTPASALRQAVELIQGDLNLVHLESRFGRILGDEEESLEAERLRYFAMAAILSERMIPRLQTLADKFSPYGLPEIYRDKGMSEPDWRGLTSFEPDGTIFKESNWSILREGYESKMIHVLHDQLERDLKDIEPVVRQMARHDAARYHVNSKTDDVEVVRKLDRQTFNAVDVMVGLLRVIQKVAKDTAFDPLAVAKNSKLLPILLSGLSIKQFQHFLHEVLEGESRVAGNEGWNFNPEYFKIEVTANQAKGRLVTAAPLSDLEVTYPIRRIGPWDELDLKFKIDDSAQRCKISEIDQNATKYGCPAHKLIAAMWDDLVGVTEKAGLFQTRSEETAPTFDKLTRDTLPFQAN